MSLFLKPKHATLLFNFWNCLTIRIKLSSLFNNFFENNPVQKALRLNLSTSHPAPVWKDTVSKINLFGFTVFNTSFYFQRK